jgi:hypothetical protein
MDDKSISWEQKQTVVMNINSTIRELYKQNPNPHGTLKFLGTQFHWPKPFVDFFNSYNTNLEHFSAFAYFTARLMLSLNFSSAPGIAANPSSPLVTSPKNVEEDVI